MWLNPIDWIEYLMLRDGSYEPLTLDFLQRNLRPSESAILAGVNNGLHSIVAARAVVGESRLASQFANVSREPSAFGLTN